MDEHDEARIALIRDFAEFYQGLDFEGVWSGDLPPRRALQLIGGLYEIPRSRYAALIRADGSFGWGSDTHLLADLDDTLLSIIYGLGGKKLTVRDLHWRPKPPADEKARPKTVAEFDVGWFLGQINS